MEIGALLLGERLTLATLLGDAMIIVSVAMLLFRQPCLPGSTPCQGPAPAGRAGRVRERAGGTGRFPARRGAHGGVAPPRITRKLAFSTRNRLPLR